MLISSGARCVRWLLPVLLLVSLPGGADELEEAKGLFREGFILYKQERYSQALTKLQAAFNLRDEAVILYNIAKCHEKLGHSREAVSYLRRYLERLDEAMEKEEVKERIRSIAARAGLPGELHALSFPSGAAVRVDGLERGITPCVVELSPGGHQVTFSKEGFLPGSETDIVVEAGLRATVVQRLVRRPQPRPPQPPGRLEVRSSVPGARVFLRDEERGTTPLTLELPPSRVPLRLELEGHRPWLGEAEIQGGTTVTILGQLEPLPSPWMPSVEAWILMASGGAALLAGGVVGTLSLTEMDSARREWRGALTLEDHSDARAREEGSLDLATGANVLFGVGGALLLAGVLTWIIEPHVGDRAALEAHPGVLSFKGAFP